MRHDEKDTEPRIRSGKGVKVHEFDFRVEGTQKNFTVAIRHSRKTETKWDGVLKG